MTTLVSFSTRQATVVVARSNYSIVSAENASVSPSVPPSQRASDPNPPLQPPIDNNQPALHLDSYRAVLCWLLNYTDAGLAPPSSIAQSFWSSDKQLADGPARYGIVAQNLQSLLAFPAWLFNANNWANLALRPNVMIDSLPREHYTRALIVAPVTKLRVDKAMFGLFLGLQGGVMLFACGMMVWIWVQSRRRDLVWGTAFPVFDVAFKARVAMDGAALERDVIGASSGDVVRIMENAKVHVKVD